MTIDISLLERCLKANTQLEKKHKDYMLANCEEIFRSDSSKFNSAMRRFEQFFRLKEILIVFCKNQENSQARINHEKILSGLLDDHFIFLTKCISQLDDEIKKNNANKRNMDDLEKELENLHTKIKQSQNKNQKFVIDAGNFIFKIVWFFPRAIHYIAKKTMQCLPKEKITQQLNSFKFAIDKAESEVAISIQNTSMIFLPKEQQEEIRSGALKEWEEKKTGINQAKKSCHDLESNIITNMSEHRELARKHAAEYINIYFQEHEKEVIKLFITTFNNLSDQFFNDDDSRFSLKVLALILQKEKDGDLHAFKKLLDVLGRYANDSSCITFRRKTDEFARCLFARLENVENLKFLDKTNIATIEFPESLVEEYCSPIRLREIRIDFLCGLARIEKKWHEYFIQSLLILKESILNEEISIKKIKPNLALKLFNPTQTKAYEAQNKIVQNNKRIYKDFIESITQSIKLPWICGTKPVLQNRDSPNMNIDGKDFTNMFSL